MARLSAVYLIAQGIAGLAWWAALFASDPFRRVFFSNGGWDTARTILAADLVFFAGGSILTGWMIRRQHSLAGVVGLVTVGATAYATVLAISWSFGSVGEWSGAIAMLGSLVLTSAAVATVWPRAGTAT